ncbi:hypothetical protein KIPB_011226 [Kipferlia bialata]|uniref:Uncharacterized protein n=1 Tax=Kipferlia bialata TaxID=797122 RepID=A0A9K3D4E5_9EUKA|nr:hypothetical protein KIPB_011226 [Kipferlia bialata]|eukprot:g11226.t1
MHPSPQFGLRGNASSAVSQVLDASGPLMASLQNMERERESMSQRERAHSVQAHSPLSGVDETETEGEGEREAEGERAGARWYDAGKDDVWADEGESTSGERGPNLSMGSGAYSPADLASRSGSRTASRTGSRRGSVGTALMRSIPPPVADTAAYSQADRKGGVEGEREREREVLEGLEGLEGERESPVATPPDASYRLRWHVTGWGVALLIAGAINTYTSMYGLFI